VVEGAEGGDHAVRVPLAPLQRVPKHRRHDSTSVIRRSAATTIPPPEGTTGRACTEPSTFRRLCVRYVYEEFMCTEYILENNYFKLRVGVMTVDLADGSDHRFIATWF
jgi:hypothetical protein